MRIIRIIETRKSGLNTDENYTTVELEYNSKDTGSKVVANVKAYLERHGIAVIRFNSFSGQPNNITLATFVTEQ